MKCPMIYMLCSFYLLCWGKNFNEKKSSWFLREKKSRKKLTEFVLHGPMIFIWLNSARYFFLFFFYSLSLSFSFSFHSCFANTITNKLWPSHEFTCVSQCVWVYTFVWMCLCLCLYLMNEWMLYDSFNKSKDSDSLFLDIRPVRIKSHAVSPRFSSSALKSQP